MLQTITINASIPTEERKLYIEQYCTLTTSEIAMNNRHNIECSTHEEMVEMLNSLPYRYNINGERDRYIVLPPVINQ